MAFSQYQCFGESRIKHSYGTNNLKNLEISRVKALMTNSVLKPNKSPQVSTEGSRGYRKQIGAGWPSSPPFSGEEGEANSPNSLFPS